MGQLNTIIFLFVLAFTINSSFAESNGFYFDDVRLKGTGCPSGTTDIIYSPGSESLSILFDQFIAEVPNFGGDNDNSPSDRFNPKINHKICDIVITANLPENQKVNSLSISLDYRGAASVDVGAKAQVKTMLMSWNGPSGMGSSRREIISEKIWDNQYGISPIDEDFNINVIKNVRTNGNNCASARKRKVTLIIKSITLAKMRHSANIDDTFAFISMDSADMAGSLSIKVNTSSCSGQSGRNDRGSRYNPRPDYGSGSSRNNPCRGRSTWNPTLRRCVRS